MTDAPSPSNIPSPINSRSLGDAPPSSDVPSMDIPTLGPALADPPPAAPPFPFWGYTDLLIVVLAFVAAYFVAGILTYALTQFLPAPATLLLGQSIFYGFGLLTLYAVISVRYGRPFWTALRWPASKLTIRKWGALGIATAIVGFALAATIGASDFDQMPMKELLSNRISIMVIGILAVTIGPLWEEITFRGFMLPLFVKSVGKAGGIAISAVIFSLMHGQQYGWAWQALVPVGFAGVCFGIARVATGSTSVSVGMHAMYNLTVFSAFLAQRGVDNLPWQ